MHAASLNSSPRLQRVLRFLFEHGESSTLEISAGAEVCAVNSAVAELRSNGVPVDCRQSTGPDGRVWLYRLANPLAASIVLAYLEPEGGQEWL